MLNPNVSDDSRLFIGIRPLICLEVLVTRGSEAHVGFASQGGEFSCTPNSVGVRG